ncbi:hypothetical protein OROHE_002645 [Orobanche hederae]
MPILPPQQNSNSQYRFSLSVFDETGELEVTMFGKEAEKLLNLLADDFWQKYQEDTSFVHTFINSKLEEMLLQIEIQSKTFLKQDDNTILSYTVKSLECQKTTPLPACTDGFTEQPSSSLVCLTYLVSAENASRDENLITSAQASPVDISCVHIRWGDINQVLPLSFTIREVQEIGLQVLVKTQVPVKIQAEIGLPLGLMRDIERHFSSCEKLINAKGLEFNVPRILVTNVLSNELTMPSVFRVLNGKTKALILLNVEYLSVYCLNAYTRGAEFLNPLANERSPLFIAGEVVGLPLIPTASSSIKCSLMLWGIK